MFCTSRSWLFSFRKTFSSRFTFLLLCSCFRDFPRNLRPIWYGTRHLNGLTQPRSLETLTFANNAIGIKAKAKNLGIVMNNTLSFNDHIDEICKKVSFAIRSIGHIRRYLPYDGLKMLVNSLVISRLDYCNSVLYGIPKYHRDKLQRIQNIAARMITGTRSTDHVTAILKSLHWLPVEARINFKILLITYNILNGESTSYLESGIQEYLPSRTLRSSTRLLLWIPSIKCNSYGGRAFSAAAPELWNSIPVWLDSSQILPPT